jgi:hypothetical protein
VYARKPAFSLPTLSNTGTLILSALSALSTLSNSRIPAFNPSSLLFTGVCMCVCVLDAVWVGLVVVFGVRTPVQETRCCSVQSPHEGFCPRVSIFLVFLDLLVGCRLGGFFFFSRFSFCLPCRSLPRNARTHSLSLFRSPLNFLKLFRCSVVNDDLPRPMYQLERTDPLPMGKDSSMVSPSMIAASQQLDHRSQDVPAAAVSGSASSYSSSTSTSTSSSPTSSSSSAPSSSSSSTASTPGSLDQLARKNAKSDPLYWYGMFPSKALRAGQIHWKNGMCLCVCVFACVCMCVCVCVCMY